MKFFLPNYCTKIYQTSLLMRGALLIAKLNRSGIGLVLSFVDESVTRRKFTVWSGAANSGSIGTKSGFHSTCGLPISLPRKDIAPPTLTREGYENNRKRNKNK